MSPLLLVHVAGGGVGILSGAAALVARKGGRVHRGSGAVFVTAMAAMALAAAALSLTLPDWGNLPGALFALYLVAGGGAAFSPEAEWRATAGRIAPVLGGGAFASALLLTFQAAASPTGAVHGKGAPLFGVFAGLTAFALVLDYVSQDGRTLARGGRLRRHIWRMGTALFFATGSFFLGQQKVMPPWLQSSPALLVLAFAPLAVMAFWLVRTAIRPRPQPAAAA